MKDKMYTMRAPICQGLTDLITYLNSTKNTKDMTMIEIGSYAGESTRLFSEVFKKVISIDPFMNDYDKNDITCDYMDLDKVYFHFINNISQHSNIEHIRKTSDEAIFDLKNLKVDFVYIDGLHTYEQVKKDIINYKPLINSGGFIGGHDYSPHWQGVKNAIDEEFPLLDRTFIDTSWIFQIK